MPGIDSVERTTDREQVIPVQNGVCGTVSNSWVQGLTQEEIPTVNQEPSTPGFGYSQLEDRLRRLQRKTKGYSKSVAMLRGSIALIYLKLGLI